MADNRRCYMCGCTEVQHLDRKKYLIDCEGFDLSAAEEAEAQAHPIEHAEFCHLDHRTTGTECDGNCAEYMASLKQGGYLDINHDAWMITQYGLVNIGS